MLKKFEIPIPFLAPKPDVGKLLHHEATFKRDKTLLDNAQSLNKVARGIQLVEQKPEYQTIKRRRDNQEPLSEIVRKSAANVEVHHASTLAAELPLRQAQAAMLKKEVGSAVTEADMLKVCTAIESHKVMKLDDPVFLEIQRRMNVNNVRLKEVKASLQSVVDQRKVAAEVWQVTEHNKNLPLSAAKKPLSAEVQTFIQQSGRTQKDFFLQAQKFQLIDQRRQALGQTLKRIDSIQEEQKRIAVDKGEPVPQHVPAFEQNFIIPSAQERILLQKTYKKEQEQLEKSRSFLKTASSLNALEQRPEYQTIQSHLKTKSVGDIVGESTIRADKLQESTLKAELPYREEEVKVLQADLKTIDKTLSKSDRNMADRMFKMATAIKNSDPLPADVDAQAMVRQLLQSRQTLDGIIGKYQKTLAEYQNYDAKKEKLAFAKTRLKEIPAEQADLAAKKTKVAADADNQALDSLRAKLKLLQEEKQTKVGVGLSVESMVKKAKKDNAWVMVGDAPPVSNDYIRLYRGVQPRGLDTEFTPPPTEKEREQFFAVMDKAMHKGHQHLSSKEKDILMQRGKFIGKDQKFFADSLDAAQRYGKDGVVYYVDVPRTQAHKWLKGNGMMEFALVVPYDVAKNANVYAVGPGAPENKPLKPDQGKKILH